MRKFSQQEEKELISFIKDWLKNHGLNQKDLAYALKIKSSVKSLLIYFKDIRLNFMGKYVKYHHMYVFNWPIITLVCVE